MYLIVLFYNAIFSAYKKNLNTFRTFQNAQQKVLCHNAIISIYEKYTSIHFLFLLSSDAMRCHFARPTPNINAYSTAKNPTVSAFFILPCQCLKIPSPNVYGSMCTFTIRMKSGRLFLWISFCLRSWKPA